MSWKDFDLADLIIKALLIGPWKNVEEVEDSLSMPELSALLKADAERDYVAKKFAAALKGIELPDPEVEDKPTFEQVQERARKKILAQQTGKTEEEIDLLSLGLDYEG